MSRSLSTLLRGAALVGSGFLQTQGSGMPTSGPDAYEAAFQAFVAKYNRTYASPEEERSRFSIFKRNVQFLEEENGKHLSYSLAVNEFADQAPREFQAERFGLSPPATGELWAGVPFLGAHRSSGAELPKALDWSLKGAVTPPKNQGRCGSCWAFSTTGALEGAWQIASGELVSLSEQQLVDCSTENNGCNGGDMGLAFKYAASAAVCTEESYNYTGEEGDRCAAARCEVGIDQGAVRGFRSVPADDERALMEAVSQQPVSVAIEADQMVFQMYSQGILTKKCGSKIDHGVLLVGYGTDDGIDYWKVKNSWGASWGEGGYIRMERGVRGPGECGISTDATYPVVSSPFATSSSADLVIV